VSRVAPDADALDADILGPRCWQCGYPSLVNGVEKRCSECGWDFRTDLARLEVERLLVSPRKLCASILRLRRFPAGWWWVYGEPGDRALCKRRVRRTIVAVGIACVVAGMLGHGLRVNTAEQFRSYTVHPDGSLGRNEQGEPVAPLIKATCIAEWGAWGRCMATDVVEWVGGVGEWAYLGDGSRLVSDSITTRTTVFRIDARVITTVLLVCAGVGVPYVVAIFIARAWIRRRKMLAGAERSAALNGALNMVTTAPTIACVVIAAVVLDWGARRIMADPVAAAPLRVHAALLALPVVTFLGAWALALLSDRTRRLF
jgi:hypothetical protein